MELLDNSLIRFFPAGEQWDGSRDVVTPGARLDDDYRCSSNSS